MACSIGQKKQCRTFTKVLLESADSMWCTRESSLLIWHLNGSAMAVCCRFPFEAQFWDLHVCLVLAFYLLGPVPLYPCIWINILAIICSSRLVAPVYGCKHSKVNQESAPVYGSHDFLGQTPISGSKMLFKILFFHDDLYCWVRNSNIKYYFEIFKT
jgi:hypothetical protein